MVKDRSKRRVGVQDDWMSLTSEWCRVLMYSTSGSIRGVRHSENHLDEGTDLGFIVFSLLQRGNKAYSRSRLPALPSGAPTPSE